VSYVNETYLQSYFGDMKLKEMDAQQIVNYQIMMKFYTPEYGDFGGEPVVQTECIVQRQSLFETRRKQRQLFAPSDPQQMELKVVFSMAWSSKTQNLTMYDYVHRFQDFMNSDVGMKSTVEDVRDLGLPVSSVGKVTIPIANIVAPTLSPSLSSNSSGMAPTFEPSIFSGEQKSSTIKSSLTPMEVVIAVLLGAFVFLYT